MKKEAGGAVTRAMVGAPGDAAFEGTCETSGGNFINDLCPREGAIAACSSKAGAETVTDVHYRPSTVPEVRVSCADDGGDFTEL